VREDDEVSASSREALCIYTTTYAPQENNTPTVVDQRNTKNPLKSAILVELKKSTAYKTSTINDEQLVVDEYIDGTERS
jgi:hypothetical protein